MAYNAGDRLEKDLQMTLSFEVNFSYNFSLILNIFFSISLIAWLFLYSPNSSHPDSESFYLWIHARSRILNNLYQVLQSPSVLSLYYTLHHQSHRDSTSGPPTYLHKFIFSPVISRTSSFHLLPTNFITCPEYLNIKILIY